ncbi:Aldehyde/histidinol dehydrogenase [Kalaharituber pfeilii]|nr:Aldehyde/histidinol dehydrogenase [Kalaharituber pfeilii]
MPTADPSLSSTLPPFVPTPISAIPSLIAPLRKTFHSGHTRPISARLCALQRLYYAICDLEQAAVTALSLDLGRAHWETFFADVNYAKSELLNVIKNMERWLADEYVSEGIPWFLKIGHETYVRKEPFGVVLVVGPWNYPWSTNLIPVFGAIAGGNTVVVKPSEVAPHSAAVVGKVFEAAGLVGNGDGGPAVVTVLQGGVDVATEVLKQRFDKICFTGSTGVGKVVARAAAEHLTPTLLELGGKNPTVITPSAPPLPTVVIPRLVWAKALNSGQSCTAPDYVLVPTTLESEFLTSIEKTLAAFYPSGIKSTLDFSRIVNKSHFTRLKSLLERTSGEVKIGGKIIDESDLLIEPTIVSLGSVDNEDWKRDPLMADEIFGPILPYATYDPATTPLAQLLSLMQEFSDTSLGAYLFSNSAAEQKLFMDSTRSGGVCINEAFMNTVVMGLPFGGVGQSGMGCYRARWTVDGFVQRRPVLRNRGGWVDWILGFRFPPWRGGPVGGDGGEGQQKGKGLMGEGGAPWKYKAIEMAVAKPGFKRPAGMKKV